MKIKKERLHNPSPMISCSSSMMVQCEIPSLKFNLVMLRLKLQKKKKSHYSILYEEGDKEVHEESGISLQAD